MRKGRTGGYNENREKGRKKREWKESKGREKKT
jgi:hypothetical protein